MKEAWARSSQTFLKPLLISSIPECVLVKAETSVDPPELAQWLPFLPVLWPLLIFLVRDGVLTRVELTKPSQICLRPLLILPTQGCILAKVEMSVDPPELA